MADLVPVLPRQLVRAGFNALPLSIARAGEETSWRFVEFFTASIRNRNTRVAYARAVYQFFLWCEDAASDSATSSRYRRSLYRASPGVEAHGEAAPRRHPDAL